MPFAERAEHLLAVRDLLLDRPRTCVDVIVARDRQARRRSRVHRADGRVETIEYYAKHGEQALRREKVSPGLDEPQAGRTAPSSRSAWSGVISPWNYPFILAMTPVLAALFAGNAVVLKPSEVTPLVGVEVGQAVRRRRRAPELVQVVTGGGATGEALVRSGVQKICFTGSVAPASG